MTEYTPEQREKASAALQKQRQTQTKQAMALLKRTLALGMMRESKLPFRICRDLLENPDQEEILPNIYFPAPGASHETMRLRPPKIGNAEEWQRLESDPERESQRRAWSAAVKAEQWKDEDWPRLFARFLLEYDFDTFKDTDWTGEKITEQEAQSVKEYLQGIQQDAQQHPENYFLKPNPKSKWEKTHIFFGINSL